MIPYEFTAQDDYSSHRPLIYAILENDKEGHPFAEFGSGHSTHTFREYCNANNRGFESYDNDMEWCSETAAKYVKDYKQVNLLMGYILFIDSKPGEERKELIELNKHKYIIIAHDVEDGANYVYGMKEILSTFKYRLDYKPEGKPWATAVSNVIDVSKWVVE
jgi:hypothetical protein